MLLIQYLFLASILVFASIKASNYIDLLDRKSKLSGALIGGVLLAATTSLPELITSLSSILILEEPNPNLAFGNVLGSNLFNITIIALIDIIFIKHFFLDRVTRDANKSILFSVVMLTIMLLSFQFGLPFSLKFGIMHFSIVSIVLLVIYFLAIYYLANISDDEIPVETDDTPVYFTIKQILIRFSLFAIILVITSIYVTKLADEIATTYQLGSSFAGALFLGVCTSLPELTSSLNLVRLRNYGVAVSNCVGSNIFNLAIISFVDFLYFKENIYIGGIREARGNIVLIYFTLAISVVLMASLLTNKSNSRFTYILPSLLILVIYLAYIVITAAL
ncbi:sodium:calcium antiporter [Haloplasma contractile]|uniref:Sodium-calcium exchanger protein n=1 Tax=Haloplasma contractile SSD-17B TaxID=1033810 RepID=U2E8K0_9MOLU|nr:cation transporter [Haloplasma contractile]ERJ11493.1 Putative sodium-calcium exchanger protein [Haloplasma contractile SSD-17B]